MTHDPASCLVLRHVVLVREVAPDLRLRWCDSGCGLLLDPIPSEPSAPAVRHAGSPGSLTRPAAAEVTQRVA